MYPAASEDRLVELTPGTTIGRFTVEDLLGTGGAGAVYRVRHEVLDRSFALKLVHHPNHHDRLLREGRLQASLSHPNVLGVVDVLEVDDGVALVLEFVDGPSLDAFLERRRPTLAQARALGDGILRGVAAAHAAGLVHRDLKPHNVLLATVDGEIVPKVADFGLVKQLDGALPQLTATGQIMGTPCYMAPEQFHGGSAAADARSDIFALGAVLYELLTGQRAFPGDPLQRVFGEETAHPHRPIEELAPDAPAAMREAVLRALSVDPAARPSSCEELRLDWGSEPVPADLAELWDDATIADVELAGQTEPSLGPSGTLRDDDTTWQPGDPGAPAASTSGADAPPRYTLLHALGAGGMGEVWLAEDRVLRRRVALKLILDPRRHAELTSRFTQEAQITGQLEHPNIVPVHDLGTMPDGTPFFTMKEVKGDALTEVIEARLARVATGSADQSGVLIELVTILARACEALSFAHAQGVVHRDLKPDNVMVGQFGEVQVMDWGIARVVGAADPDVAVVTDRSDAQQVTRMGTITGTPAFMAPEQARGELDQIGPHTDVWSMGVILYWIVAGRQAFEGGTYEVLAQVQEGRVVPPSERVGRPVPRELEAIVLRAMAPAPSDRYADMEQLLLDLRAWLAGLPLASLDYGRGELALKWVRRHRTAVSVFAVTAFLATMSLAGMGVRYVRDVREARDDAEQAADLARQAEAVATTRLAEARIAQGAAEALAGRIGTAREAFREARSVLAASGRSTLAADLGAWGTHARSRAPLLELPGTVLGAHRDGDSLWLLVDDEIQRVAVPVPEVRERFPSPPGTLHAGASEPDGFAVYTVLDGAVHRTVLGQATERLFPVDEMPAWVSAFDEGRVVTARIRHRRSVTWVRHAEGWSPLDLGPRFVMASVDGLMLASEYQEPTDLVDPSDGSVVRALDPTGARVVVTPDGQTLIAAFEDRGVLQGIDPRSGVVRWTVPTALEVPVSVTPDGRWFHTVTTDDRGAIRDVATGALGVATDGPGQRISVHHAATNEVFATSWNGRTTVWAAVAEQVGQMQLPERAQQGDLAPDGQWVFASTVDSLELLDGPSGRSVARWPAPGPARLVRYAPDGRSVAVDYGDGRIDLVDLTGGGRQVVHLPGGTRLGTASEGALFVEDRTVVRRVDPATEEVVWTSEAIDGRIRQVTALPGGLFVTNELGPVVILDPATGDRSQTLDLGGQSYLVDVHDEQAAFAMYGGSAILAHRDGQLRTLPAVGEVMMDVAFSPSGEHLVGAYWDGALRIHDEASLELVATDTLHSDVVTLVLWPEAGLLVSAAGEVWRRELDIDQTMRAGRAALEKLSTGAVPTAEEQLAMGRALEISGLYRAAAQRYDLGGAPAEVRARAWMRAGDRAKSQEAAADMPPGVSRSAYLGALGGRGEPGTKNEPVSR